MTIDFLQIKGDVNMNENNVRFDSISSIEAKITISKIKMHRII